MYLKKYDITSFALDVEVELALTSPDPVPAVYIQHRPHQVTVDVPLIPEKIHRFMSCVFKSTTKKNQTP